VKICTLFAALTIAGMTTIAIAQTTPPGGRNGEGEGSGGGERRGPPPQAIEACKGKSSGDTCSFSGRDKTEHAGKCFTPNPDHPLACRPPRPEKRPEEKSREQGSGGQEINY